MGRKSSLYARSMQPRNTVDPKRFRIECSCSAKQNSRFRDRTVSRSHTSCCEILLWKNQLLRRDSQPVAVLLLQSVTQAQQSNGTVEQRNSRFQWYTRVVAAVTASRNRRKAAVPAVSQLSKVLLGLIFSYRNLNEQAKPKGRYGRRSRR